MSSHILIKKYKKLSNKNHHVAESSQGFLFDSFFEHFPWIQLKWQQALPFLSPFLSGNLTTITIIRTTVKPQE